MAQKTGRSVNLERTLAELARFYIEKSDPLQKARRAEARREKREGKTNHNSDRERDFTEPRNQNSESLCPGKKIDESLKKRRPLKARIKHAVFLRDKGCCQHKLPDGSICGERKWIEIHHLKSVADGGLDELNNLTILCSQHHHLRH